MSQYVRNLGAMIGQSTIQRLMGMLTTIVLARVLGSANFGIYSIVVNTASSAYGLVRMGVDAAIHVHTAEQQSDAVARGSKGQMLAAGLILLTVAGLLGAVACLVLAKWLAETIYGQPELEEWIRFASILVFFQCLSQFCYAGLAGLHRFKEYATVITVTSTFIAIFISAASLLWNVRGALYTFILMQGVVSYLLWRAIRNALVIDKVALRYSQLATSFRSLINTGIPFYAAGLLAMPVSYYLQGSLSRDVGLDALGQLRVIAAITSIVTFVPTSIAAVMISHLARESGSNYESFVQKSLTNLKYIWAFVLLSSTATFCILPTLLDVIFGDAYASATGAASVALIATVLTCVLGVVGNVALARKRLRFVFGYTLMQAAVFVALGSHLIPRKGLTGYFLAEGAGVGCALLFVWLASRTWRKRNEVAPKWIGPMLALTIGSAVAFSTPVWLEDGGRNWMIGLGAMMLSSVVIYRMVLDETERDLLKARVQPGRKT